MAAKILGGFLFDLRCGVTSILAELEGTNTARLRNLIAEILPNLRHLARFPDLGEHNTDAWVAYRIFEELLDDLRLRPNVPAAEREYLLCGHAFSYTEFRSVLENLLEYLQR